MNTGNARRRLTVGRIEAHDPPEEVLMNRLGRTGIGVLAGVLVGMQTAAPAQTAPAQTAPASTREATATAAMTSATRPTVAELLSHKTATFDFNDATIPELVEFISKTYDMDIFNTYDLKGLVTMKSDKVNARQAINSLNSAILALGYTVVESVRGNPPRIVLTIVPTRSDAGSLVPVFYGSNPDKIPEGTEMRTQIMTFTGIDPEKVRTYLSAVIGSQADMQVNAASKSITLTDTGSHVHAAASLLQTLEKQADPHP
jgi:type II secretory pathway component GspD/PulD (secretin)